MQVIRLARVGRNKYPTYRIVTADKRRAANGKFMTILGHYNPHTKELVIKREELQTAIEHGAQPSNTVLKLMLKDGIELPKWATIKSRKKVTKKPVEEKAEEPKTDEVKAEATNTTESTVEVATEQAEAAETKETPKEDSETPTEADKAVEADKTTEKVADVVIEEAQKEAKDKE